MPIFNHGLPIKANVIQGEGGTDTSKDTVTPETLLEGVTAHNAAGEPIVGTCDYNANTESDTVTAEKLVLGETAHDASGAQITGTLDTEAIRDDGFWDKIQNYGKLTKYDFFLSGKFWTKENFKPKYDIRPTSLYMFVFLQSGLGIDMPAICEECGIVFDTSQCTDFQYSLGSSVFSRLGVIDARGAESLNTQMFFSSQKLHTIEKLIVKETHAFGPYTFSGCSGLTTLNIEGTIGQNGLNLSSSPLNKASLISVVNALSDTTTGLTVTLRMSAIKTAFETSEGAADGNTSEEWLNLVATKSNWTINAID